MEVANSQASGGTTPIRYSIVDGRRNNDLRVLLLFSSGRSNLTMVFRSSNLYKTLALLFFLFAVFIILGSLAFVTITYFQAAFIIIGVFILVISFSYFTLSRQENKGDTG
jgi:hypothetical protein